MSPPASLPPSGTGRSSTGPGSDVSPALKIEGLSKTFTGQRALDDVSIEIGAARIHALVGQNGSGKSTLIKVLSGFHQPDPGVKAWLSGEPFELGASSEGLSDAIRFVHQDLALVPSLTVRENLNLERNGRGRLAPFERRVERTRVHKLLATFSIDVDPDGVIADLSPFERAAVAIVRAVGDLTEDVRLLVLDEPTASLGASEVTQLFETLRHVNRELGIAVLYVSHFLAEILDIAEQITVLRDGRVVAEADAQETTEEDLVRLIVGSSLADVAPPSFEGAGDPVLSVDGLVADGCDDVSLAVYRGEILGLTGLVDSGHEAIAKSISGETRWDSGEVVLAGRRHRHLTPGAAAGAGISYVPADRGGSGLIPTFTLAENVGLPDAGRSFRRGVLSRRRERRDALPWLKMTEVVPLEPDRKVEELSGGNQQKVLLAKALRLDPEVLVLAQPTQSVDVGAAASIRKLVTDFASNGRAVVVSSLDPAELEEICHRVLVTRDGRIACELTGDDISEDRIVYECQFEGGNQ